VFSSDTEAKFFDVIGTKVLRVFILACFSQSPPPPPLEKKWFQTGMKCKHCTGKPQVWELSRLCPEISTKLYVHEFGFRSHVGVAMICMVWSVIGLAAKVRINWPKNVHIWQSCPWWTGSHTGGSQRDVVYLGGPIAPNAGGGGCGVSTNEYSCAHGAQINFGDLTPYLTYDLLHYGTGLAIGLPKDGLASWVGLYLARVGIFLSMGGLRKGHDWRRLVQTWPLLAIDRIGCNWSSLAAEWPTRMDRTGEGSSLY
jgi:hypothetical protein